MKEFQQKVDQFIDRNCRYVRRISPKNGVPKSETIVFDTGSLGLLIVPDGLRIHVEEFGGRAYFLVEVNGSGYVELVDSKQFWATCASMLQSQKGGV